MSQVTLLGPRPAGSPALLAARDLLGEHLGELVRQAGDTAVKAKMDIQTVSGELLNSHRWVYREVPNLLLRLSSNLSSSTPAVLVNCHFDSAVQSPGASDNILNCALMLEVARLVILADTNLTSDIIFLFNGAEESGLVAAHGFIIQHHWAESCAAFVNLEGAGAGGRELLFQVTRQDQD